LNTAFLFPQLEKNMVKAHLPDREFYRRLPKVDLHRHLEGSLRFSTVREVSRSLGLDLPGTDVLATMVQIQEEEPNTFENFLSKFQTLRLFYRSPEIIGRIAREAVMDAAADNIRYLELRFTPAALSRAEGYSLADVMDWVIVGAGEASIEAGIKTNLIASVNRHESPALAEEVVALAVERKTAGIVGVDLAGNEVHFPAAPFANIFQDAKKEGLHVTVHAGEWAGAKGVAEAVLQLGAERIGHGIRVVDDPVVVQLAREREVTFEVCLTSNVQSGAVESLAVHPLPAMLAAGLSVTLHTDDPSISRITLGDEYSLAQRHLGLAWEDLNGLILNGARTAFLPEEERQRLCLELQQHLQPDSF
jgi:adenosine deaminase